MSGTELWVVQDYWATCDPFCYAVGLYFSYLLGCYELLSLEIGVCCARMFMVLILMLDSMMLEQN